MGHPVPTHRSLRARIDCPWEDQALTLMTSYDRDYTSRDRID